MKKFFLLMCVCAGLCACSSDDDLVSSSSSEMPDGTVSYLTVKIKDVGSSTRATSTGYANGTSDEYTVNNAYFYFYDDEGNYVAKGNVADIGGEATENTDGNIEYESSTVVAVWGITNPSLPTKMVTILNKPSDFDGTNMSLSQMEAALTGTLSSSATTGFVMSNSSYYSSGVIDYTPLTADNFRTEPVAIATDYADSEDIVNVYVERLAAKVQVDIDSDILWNQGNQSGQYDIQVTEAMFEDWAKAPESVQGSTYIIQLQGWNVNGTARNSLMLKNITPFASSWVNTPGFNDWDQAGDYRCYWAASEAYGDAEHLYPGSNYKLNTDADEEDASTWLDSYLKFTSLDEGNALAFAGSTYCAENTNTAEVINSDNDSIMNCLTNVIVKAQFGLDNNSTGAFEGVDIVKYHGEYLTLADFEADMISEVMAYDIKTLSQEVADAIVNQYGQNQLIGTIVKDLANAIENDVVYMKKTSDTSADYEVFDSRFLELNNMGSGKVGIWFNTTTSSDIEGNVHYPTSETKGHSIPSYYTGHILESYKGESMDDYTFAFKVDLTKLTDNEVTLLNTFGILEDGYVVLSDDKTITITTVGGNEYTLHQYFIRAIEREAAGINDDWEDAGYPILYAEGLMYYAVPIEHLASASATNPDTIVEGQYGVVRNHWYDITVNSVTNFGHGIADPAEVIVPNPEEDYYYLGADINILSWKMVEQSVNW